MLQANWNLETFVDKIFLVVSNKVGAGMRDGSHNQPPGGPHHSSLFFFNLTSSVSLTALILYIRTFYTGKFVVHLYISES